MEEAARSANTEPPIRHRQLTLWTEAAAYLLILAELCWVLPWYLVVIQISHVASPWRAALVLGGMMLSGYWFTQTTDTWRLLKRLQSLGLGLLLVIGLIVATALLLEDSAAEVLNRLLRIDPGAMLVVFAVFWLWWRGLTLARETVRPWQAWRRFQTGMLLYLAYLLVAFRFPQTPVSLPLMGLFIFSGLAAVICARIAHVQVKKQVARNPFDRRWVLSVSAGLGAAVLAGLSLASLATGQLRLLLESLRNVIQYAIFVLVYILSLPGMLVAYLIYRWEDVIRRMLEGLKLQVQLATPVPNHWEQIYIPPEAVERQYSPLPGTVLSALFWLVMFGLLLLVVLRQRQRHRSRQWGGQDTSESVLQPGELRRMLGRLIQGAWEGYGEHLRARQRRLAAKRIRRIYAELLDLVGELNLPRPAASTPLEFLPAMQGLLPACAVELQQITQAYIRVRYGEFPETREELEIVEAAWQRVAAEGKRQKAKRVGTGSAGDDRPEPSIV